MKTLATSLLLTLACFTAFADQVLLTMENDTFLTKSDNDYTHATELKYITDSGWHYKVQQNMYTPRDISIKEHIDGDRPYCGLLTAGIGKEVFQDITSPWTHYAELDFGVIGPASLAGQTQKFIHKILGCHEPKGWSNQLHNELVVNAQWWTKYNWLICDYVAIVPRVGAEAGTIQDAVEVGVDLKVGWNLQRDVGSTIMFSTTPQRRASWLDKLCTYAYAGVDERYYLYNHILEGSLFNHKDKDLKVDIEPFVPEARVGVVVKYGSFFATWYGVFRGHEFKGQKQAPDYGGISIGWSW